MVQRSGPSMVRITRAEYQGLLADRQRLRSFEPGLSVSVNPGSGGALLIDRDASFAVPTNPGAGSVSPIDLDADLAAFIRARLGRLTLHEIAWACYEQFGPDRAPSKSAIHRYWVRLNSRSDVKKERLKSFKGSKSVT